MNLIFYIASVIAIVASIMAITRYHALHAILYLIVSLVSVSIVFYALGAPFIAALEVITYAGAIMVLFLFAIMLLNIGSNAIEQEKRWQPLVRWVGPAILGMFLLVEFWYVFSLGKRPMSGSIGPKLVGANLFGPYLLGVELASMLLLAGLIGAYHLGRHALPLEKGNEYDSHSA